MRQVLLRSWHPSSSIFNHHTCKVTSSNLSPPKRYPAINSNITTFAIATSSTNNTCATQTRYIHCTSNNNKMASATTFYDFKPKDSMYLHLFLSQS